MKNSINIDHVNENIDLIYDKNGLKLSTDAYFLYSFIHESKYSRGIELGTGTGIISLLCLAKNKCQNIKGFEVQPNYAKIASDNAIKNRFDERFQIINEDIRNYTIPGTEKNTYDFIFTNPPYFKVEAGYRNHTDDNYIARHEVYGNIDDFCSFGAELLKTKGNFYVVYPTNRIADLFFSLKSHRLEPKKIVFLYPNISSVSKICLVKAQKDAHSDLKIKNFYFYQDENNQEFTQEYQNVYETGELIF